jgi:hypothetical protein
MRPWVLSLQKKKCNKKKKKKKKDEGEKWRGLI